MYVCMCVCVCVCVYIYIYIYKQRISSLYITSDDETARMCKEMVVVCPGIQLTEVRNLNVKNPVWSVEKLTASQSAAGPVHTAR